jgi:hypothetical protein
MLYCLYWAYRTDGRVQSTHNRSPKGHHWFESNWAHQVKGKYHDRGTAKETASGTLLLLGR